MRQPRWDEPIEYRGQLRPARPEEMIELTELEKRQTMASELDPPIEEEEER